MTPRDKVLDENDTILCVYAKAACGPGWSNTPLWVVVRNSCNGDICEVCIQPEQQTLIMRSLYSISHAVNDQLVKEADKLLRKSNCKPLPKKVEKPQPDRNQTLTPAEAQLMQTAAVEETIAFDDDWRGAIDIKLDELTRRLDAVEAKDIRAVAHDELLAILFKNWNKTAMPANPFYARTTDDKGL